MTDLLPVGWFFLRTPLLPIDELIAWGDGLTGVWSADCERLRGRLREIVMRPDVREALFVASRSLVESMDVWLRDPESERGQRIERALGRYVSRMTWRSTPFGLFAGGSFGKLGDQTALGLPPRDGYRRHARLDMDYVSRLIDTIVRDPALRERLSYRLNSSLYRAASRFRYVEGRLLENVRQYWTVSVEATDALEQTLGRAADGARVSFLAQALVDDDPELTLDEAREFIEELIDAQILVPELAPFLTGPEPVGALIAELREHALHALAEPLEEVRDALDALDGVPLGVPPSRYDAIADRLASLPARVDAQRLFQVDMVKPAPGLTLGTRMVREAARSVELLHRLSRAWDGLRSFREAFLRRYEGREVPLVEALDDETGIGLPMSVGAPAAEEATPLLEGIGFPPPQTETVNWGDREGLLLQLAGEAQRRGLREVALGEMELQVLEAADRAPLPHALTVTFTVVPHGEDFRLLVHHVAGPSGAETYGRFCHSDPDLCSGVRAQLEAEEAHRPDAVYAEIVHLPQGRMGNILLRPVLRRYEIPYLGRSAAPESRQIPVTDLSVSVRQGRVVLRSGRLGKEVVPCMTTAHGFSNTSNVGLYRFLCMLRYQGFAQLGWEWGPLAKAAYLPRLVAGKTILSRARWRLTGRELEPVCSVRGAERFRRMQELRRELDLPRHVLIADVDRQLPIDLDNALSVEIFTHLAAREREVTLVEMYPEPEAAVVHGAEGRFTHELSLPFVRRVEAAASRPVSAPVAVPPRTRVFVPGSEWLYAKFYSGAETTDEILGALAPAVRAATASGAAWRWFFIRYGDPDWHLRFRVQGDSERLQRDVFPAMQAAVASMLDDGRVWRVSLDTYEREVERYGGLEAVVLSEQIFHADSEAVLCMLETLSGDEGLDARWRLTLRGIDALLDDFGLDLPAKTALVKRQRAAFFREFRGGRSTEQQLSDKYRGERRALEELMELAIEPLAVRSARVRPLAAAIRDSARDDLAGSHVHMHANRLLRSAHRAQELVLYDFLSRLYESRLARRS